jgi:hypothetical protein
MYVTCSSIATLNNVTVADNHADSVHGGGIQIQCLQKVVMSNTILADNTAPRGPECDTFATAASIKSDDYNLIEDPSGCFIEGTTTNNITGVDPGLGDLGGNGGPTDTHAIPLTSAATNAGNPAGPGGALPACTLLDQRGTDRDVRCDIGAFEIADADGDGVPNETDCAPEDPDYQQAVVEYPDGDGDGVRDSTSPTPLCVPTGTPASAGTTYNVNGPDNCPGVVNANQANADGDALGDVCDPFPSNPDNEEAQCLADVAACQADYATLQSAYATLLAQSNCPSTVTTIPALQSEVDGLATSNGVKKDLTAYLTKATTHLAEGTPNRARTDVRKFIDRVVTSMNATGAANIAKAPGNHLLCSASNVLVTIP